MAALTADQVQQSLSVLPSNQLSEANFAGNITRFGDKSFWIVDTGASDHIIFDISVYHTYENVANTPPVKLPNGSFVPISHIGYVYLTPKFTIGKCSLHPFIWLQSSIYW